MFRHIGKKVKTLAWIKFIVELVLIVLVSLLFFLMPDPTSILTTLNITNVDTTALNWLTTVGTARYIVGGLVLVIGFLIAWLGNWALYAIGEAADNKEQIDYLLLVLDDRKASSRTISK